MSIPPRLGQTRKQTGALKVSTLPEYVLAAHRPERLRTSHRPLALLRWLAPILLAVLAMLSAPRAHAQTPAPLAEWQYSVGVPLEKMFEGEPQKWEVRVGAAASVRPYYEGTSKYYVLAGPVVDIRYRDVAFLSTGEGLDWNVIHTDHVRAGIALTYDFGRREKHDHDHLGGLGNIGMALESKVFAEYVVSKEFPLVIRANVRRQFGGANGVIGDIGAYMPLPGSNEKFFWFAGPTMTFADSAYMSRWYGVSADQATRSGLPQHRASGGIKSYGGGVSAMWFFGKNWFTTADIGVSALVGDARSSPVTSRSTSLTGDISINYQF